MTSSPPDCEDFWWQASRSLLRGDHAAALAIALTAAEYFPADPQFREIIAECAVAMGDDDLAEQALRQWIKMQPHSIKALNQLGILYDRQQRVEEALQTFTAARDLAPEDASVLTNLGILHEHCKDYALAESLQRRAFALAPRSARIAVNLAALLARMDRLVEAERYYRVAVTEQPDFAVAHANLGMLYADMNRFGEAEAALRHALALDSAHTPAYTALAPVLLAQGRFEEGWTCFEQRQTVSFFKRWFAADPVRSACRYWQGETLEGKSILVFPEQGFGDEIQFARYLYLLRAHGAAHITQICYPEQTGIMRSQGVADLVISLPEAAQHREAYDYWSLLMSMPGQLRTDIHSIPARIPYLMAEPELVSEWKVRLAQQEQGKRVGIVWRGNPKHSNDADRSLSGIEVLRVLWEVRGVRFIDLTREVSCLAEAASARQPRLLIGDELKDFSDMAAVLSQLDLLISVDSAAAHLAGALGVPCCLLLPAFRTDWRWLQGRDESPWYPGMRLFRQRIRGDWNQPVGEVKEYLQRIVGEGGQWCVGAPLPGVSD